MQNSNPLLQGSGTPVDYAAVTLDNLRAAFDLALDAHQQGIERIIAAQQTLPTWDDLVLAVDALDSQLQAVLFAASPLTFKGDTWAALLGELYGKLILRYEQKLSNKALRACYVQLSQSPQGQNLDAHERAVIQWYIRQFTLKGALLDEAELQVLAEAQARIQDLEARYRANIARDGVHVSDEQLLGGFSPRMREELRANAEASGTPGWLIPADDHWTRDVMAVASNRELREAVYRRYHTRGVSADDSQDNGKILAELATVRAEKAKLLGFSDHASLSLREKSAGSLDQVQRFLQTLAGNIKPAMGQLRLLLDARAEGLGIDQVRPWDRLYLHRAGDTAQASLPMATFREYFPLANVVASLARMAQQVFGLTLKAGNDASPVATWHESVMAFEVWQDHAYLGLLYLDAVQYPGKQADLVETRYVRNRRVDAEGVYQAAVVMVFTDVPAGLGQESPLLDHLALRKIHHEFGHALHHLLVRTTTHVGSAVSLLGTDGVEMYGKLLERWAWEADYLVDISSHKDSGEKLGLEETRTLLAALQREEVEGAAQNLLMALFDLDLHASPDDGKSLQQRMDAARELCGYWPLEDFERPAHAFDYLVNHYDAGYYAYVWSDVHAFDLFSRFRANGLLDRATGRALQEELLAHGSARPLLTGIEAFLGRAVDLGPYLHWHGLA